MKILALVLGKFKTVSVVSNGGRVAMALPVF